jgi:hypothetical protein
MRRLNSKGEAMNKRTESRINGLVLELQSFAHRHNLEIPISENNAMKIRGVGRVAITEMAKRGFVILDKDRFNSLSTRAKNCLLGSDCFDKEDVAKAVESGKIAVGKTLHCGEKTLAEIKKWCGVNFTEMEIEKSKATNCP